MGPAWFQIMSDLHLETHPSHTTFEFEKTGFYLALLGDIGHVADDRLFTFLETQVRRYRVVFFLLGNHEPYHLSFETAKRKVRAFEARMKRQHSKSTIGQFIFLDQTRFDLTDELTILGCTLFSSVSAQQEFAVESRLVDFRDIIGWTVDDHNLAHQSDLAWLNSQVSNIARDEPNRRVVIFTHHCPSVDPRCTDPKHRGSEVWTGFVTDLSKEECWVSPAVIAWAFGHTHFNCNFTDECGKAIISNQKGYYLIPERTFNAQRVFKLGAWLETSSRPVV